MEIQISDSNNIIDKAGSYFDGYSRAYIYLPTTLSHSKCRELESQQRILDKKTFHIYLLKNR